MTRNYDIEKRISKRKENDIKYKKNSYGGMGLDSISGDYKKMIYEELDYIKKHPEIYKKKYIPCDPNIYLINLK